MKKTLIIPWMIALILFYSIYIDKVSASELEMTFSGFWHIFNNNINETWTGSNPICYSGQTGNQQTCNFTKIYTFDTNYTQNPSNGYVMKIPFNYMLSTQTQEGTIKPVEYEMSFFIVSTEGSWYSCLYNSGNILCPLESNKSYKQIVIQGKANYDILSNYWTWYMSDYASIWITGQSAITNSINEQTQQQQQQHEEMMNETQEYKDETNTNINGANETIEYEQAESQLIESLEVNESIMSDISINPQASAFIWNIADQLRNMNPNIIILMTSILGIGIFKLILNR